MTAVAALGVNLAATAAALLALVLGAFVIGRRVGRHSVIDVAWGIGFVAVAGISALLATADPARAWLLFALTAVWGVRLAAHIGTRALGHGEDPRYDRLLSRAPGSRDAYALRMVYLLQGGLIWLISLPVQVSAHTSSQLGPVAFAGAALWLFGFAFEAVGDAQLRRFKADPANRGRIMDRGLWAWTRHPNYFGDACVWWGLFLVACGSWWALLTLPSLAVMTYLLTRGSGQRLLDEYMSDRPGWAEYADRTSAFLPRPPRRR